MEEEMCAICDHPTGNAGILDGSLFDVDCGGPYCEECWDKLSPELKEENDTP